MGRGVAAQCHVVPTLRQRVATFLPSTSISVRKATREFDTYLHHIAAQRGNYGYELPKSAVKRGVSTVDVDLTQRQVEILFPDASARKVREARTLTFQACRYFLCFMVAIGCARMYYEMTYQPPPPRIDWKQAWLNTYPILAGYLMFFLTITLWCVETFAYCVWRATVIFWPTLEYVDHAVLTMGGMASDLYIIIRQMAFVAYYVWKAGQQSICDIHYIEWFCPERPPPPTLQLLERVQVSATQMFWQVVPLTRQHVFWQSVFIFFVVFYVLRWLSRSRTVWTVRLKIESQAFSIAQIQKTRAMNESTSDKVAACPIITHVANYVMTEHKQVPVAIRDVYLHVCLLIAAGWADNRVREVECTESEPDTAPVESTERESLGDLGKQKRLLKTRNNTAPPNVWRRSVRVFKKSWSQLFDDVQRGQTRKLPDADEECETYCGVVSGPEFFKVTEGFEGGVEDEIAGVSRHLRQLKSLVTGEYIPREISPDAAERLDKATELICRFVVALVDEHYLSILDWTLPTKWGNARSLYYQRLVEVGRTTITPVLTGFVKLAELALPINKLPRLVGSMGMLACAKDAACLCSVEQLFKKFMPHLVVKGMTQDGIASRFAKFTRRAKRYGRKILSIDMSAMDSSWTEDDRRRVRTVLEAIVDRLQHLLEAELQKDYVGQCRQSRRALRWLLKYIEVQLAAEDSLLFSGERGTSIGNRILMLIVFAAELLRVYGNEEGAEKIEKMLHCPLAGHKVCTDERAVGRVEQFAPEDNMPDDPDCDINIGDGDDCTLSLHQEMYASMEEFVLAWEQYHKLVEPCSSWDEDTDMECLSLMCIHARDRAYFVPKVQRNAQRLIAHKLRIVPGTYFANGVQTYEPVGEDYAEIATDLWQRSFALKETMVLRHLCRAMFYYCLDKCKGYGTVYDDDMKRLGKVDGDYRLEECAIDVDANSVADVNAWVMVKATNFATAHKLSASEVNALKKEWYEADQTWSQLEITDDFCAKPDVLLTNLPIGPNVAAALGFSGEYVELLKRQLVKGQRASPDMSADTRPGGAEASSSDAAKQQVLATSVIVVNDGKVLCGYEPHGKPRAGMLTFPGGKLEKGETFRTAAVRELCEEAGLWVDPDELKKVRQHDCGKFSCVQFCVDYKLTRPSDVLHADRLTKLEYRDAGTIMHENAPANVANNLREVIVDGAFTHAALHGETFGQTIVSPVPPKAQTKSHTPTAAAGSSPARGSAFEVKRGVAEASRTGPLQMVDDYHDHICPCCGEQYTHKHRHNPNFEHKQWKGQCPNKLCEFSRSDRRLPPREPSVSARTSSDYEKFRQSRRSSLVNGYGPDRRGVPEGKGKGEVWRTHDLSRRRASSRGCGKSQPSSPESNGVQGDRAEDKRPKRWKPKIAETGDGGQTLHPEPSGPGIVPGSSDKKVRISGEEVTEPRDAASPPGAPKGGAQ